MLCRRATLPAPRVMGGFQSAFLFGLGLAGGASLVVQAALNAGLRARLGSVSWAGLISYVGGTVAMVLALAIGREAAPVTAMRTTAPLWWLGGFFGAAYLGVSIVLVPRMGAATVVALVVAGQLLTSLLFDQLGVLDIPTHPLTLSRSAGALLLVGGVLLIRR